MQCDCYLRRGTVFLPTVGKVDKNVYFLVEPVTLVPVSNSDALRAALQETIERGNPSVKYDRSAPSILAKYAGVKSWGAFAQNASLWVIEATDGIFRIQPNIRDNNASFTIDKNATETMPAGSTVDDLIERMIAILQEAASKGRSN
jgi:hypothetical protein